LLKFVLLNCVTVTAVVMIHYEILRALSRLLPKMHMFHRFRISLGVIGALSAHAFEVWVFALVYFYMINNNGWGGFEGSFDGSFMDCVYFSFTTFTTLGFGDIQPQGAIRYLTGIESLTGLVLITWSASFLYFEMQKYWELD